MNTSLPSNTNNIPIKGMIQLVSQSNWESHNFSGRLEVNK